MCFFRFHLLVPVGLPVPPGVQGEEELRVDGLRELGRGGEAPHLGVVGAQELGEALLARVLGVGKLKIKKNVYKNINCGHWAQIQQE